MPLSSTFPLQWYGPAAGAAVVPAPASATASISALARATASIPSTSSTPLADATRLINSPATITGTTTITTAAPRARARIAATIRVNALSQDDVTGAVLEAQVEPGLTLKQALLEARRAAALAAALSA